MKLKVAKKIDSQKDQIKLHNKFGVFEQADDMEFEETPMCTISIVHPP